MQRIMLVLLAFCAAGTAGCGTMLSRDGAPAFGAYPYQSVVPDGQLVVEAFKDNIKPSDSVMLVGLAVVSLPIDLCADTVLLPVDVICWIAGEKKNPEPWYNWHFPGGA